MNDRWKKGSLHASQLLDKVNIKGLIKQVLQEYEVKQAQAACWEADRFSILTRSFKLAEWWLLGQASVRLRSVSCYHIPPSALFLCQTLPLVAGKTDLLINQHFSTPAVVWAIESVSTIICKDKKHGGTVFLHCWLPEDADVGKPKKSPERMGKFQVARKRQFYICQPSSRHLQNCQIAILFKLPVNFICQWTFSLKKTDKPTKKHPTENQNQEMFIHGWQIHAGQHKCSLMGTCLPAWPNCRCPKTKAHSSQPVVKVSLV